MARLVILDLFCGGGGASLGYMQAGFDVMGIDISPHKNYPGTFIQADVFNFDYSTIKFDAIHASPPCQNYSVTTAQYRLAGKIYPDLVARTRYLLRLLDKPYIIENVPAAPLLSPITLCGISFGLKVYRHRKFEANFLLFQPEHLEHKNAIGQNGFLTITGNSYNSLPAGKVAMGVTSKMTRKELSESIPPAYTKYLGLQLAHILNSSEMI